MDGLSEEERSSWTNRIIALESNTDYWRDQVFYYDCQLQELEAIKSRITQQSYNEQLSEFLQSRRESMRNFQSEERMLNRLQAEQGNITVEQTAPSSSKRGAEHNASEQLPSKKH